MDDSKVDAVARIADFIETAQRAGLFPKVPITGGMFSGRNCWMGSKCAVQANGLHTVTYGVIEKASGLLIGMGPTKASALSQARNLLASMRPDIFDRLVLMLNAEAAARLKLHIKIREGDEFSAMPSRGRKKSIPARRRRIFEKSGGKCHYCACDLQLEGKWHIEHMMPRALGGTSDPGNLVAACLTCNYKKRDKTAEEFISGKDAVEGTV